MSKSPSHDKEKLARIRRKIGEYAREITWEPSVHAAMRGSFSPALKKCLKGDSPPPLARDALEKALARFEKGRKGRPPTYWGLLRKRERLRTPLLRAVKKYKELMALGFDKKEAEKLAVEWANVPLQNPPKLIDARMRGKVTVSQLRAEIRSGNAQRAVK